MKPIYVILIGSSPYWEVDQTVEGDAIMKREKRDLIKMGCKVKVKKFASWDEAEAYEVKIRGY